MNISSFCSVLFILFFSLTGCGYKSTGGLKRTDSLVNTEVLKSAKSAVNLWLTNDVEGIQFLKNSKWKIDDKVFLNSRKDRGYVLLLNQDKDVNAELDYVQTLYAAKDSGQWVIYLASLPNIIVPRKKENGRFRTNSLTELAELGEKEIKNSTAGINDDFIDQEYTADLKMNHYLFLARKIKK